MWPPIPIEYCVAKPHAARCVSVLAMQVFNDVPLPRFGSVGAAPSEHNSVKSRGLADH
jgi:hypothetical protein